jgi:hypothetical protein
VKNGLIQKNDIRVRENKMEKVRPATKEDWYEWLIQQDEEHRTLESVTEAVDKFIAEHKDLMYATVGYEYFSRDLNEPLSYMQIAHYFSMPTRLVYDYMERLCNMVNASMFRTCFNPVSTKQDIRYLFADNIKILNALTRMKFKTIEDVIYYYMEHNGLTSIPGIGPNGEEEIVKRLMEVDGFDKELPDKIAAWNETEKYKRIQSRLQKRDEVLRDTDEIFSLLNGVVEEYGKRHNISEHEATLKVRMACRKWLIGRVE